MMLSSGTTWEIVLKKKKNPYAFAILERQLDQVGQAQLLFIVGQVKQEYVSQTLWIKNFFR